jgi:hypothetical protein
MEVQVPDDYQVPSTHPGAFWKDLKKKVGKNKPPDIWKGDAFDGIWDVSFDGFYIDNMVLEYLQRVYLLEDGKKESEPIILEHVPLHR